MPLALLLLIGFTLWTLFHWQDLPSLLRDESDNEKWPLSIHHTSTPLRMLIVASLYIVYSASIFYGIDSLLQHYLAAKLSPWLTLLIMVAGHFIPYISSLYSFIRYFFQRHLFFPSLPSHQEDHVIKILMSKANQHSTMLAEIENLHDILDQEFSSGMHAINLVALRKEYNLVEREFNQLRRRSEQHIARNDSTGNEELLRFHLYSCYRLFTRKTLSGSWSGKDRRQAFREKGYAVNASDGGIYSRVRRLRFMLVHAFTHNRTSKKID